MKIPRVFKPLTVAMKRGLWPMLAIVLAWQMAAPSHAAADRVTLQKKGSTSRLVVSGTIEDYTGHDLSLRSNSGNAVKKYDAADVAEIETAYLPEHDEALDAWKEGDFPRAQRAWEAELKLEKRTWVRRDALARLVQCAVRRGDYATAGHRFLALYESDPATRRFPVIPLVWHSEKFNDDLYAEAEGWMAREADVPRLLGASLLLSDAKMAEAARTTLKQLSGVIDLRVQALAQAQLWRSQITTGGLTDAQLADWREKADHWPVELRAGPYFTLGRAYALRHQYEQAALVWLWLPLVEEGDGRLAARAEVEAARALQRIGQQEEARSLYQEVRRRYPDTPAAAEAAGLLESPRGE